MIFPGNYIFTLDADAENFVNVWCSGLVGFTGDEIKTGLQACTNILDPPNLARFKTLCRQPKPKQNYKAYQTVKYLQLQNLDINSIAAKAEMRLIKVITNANLDDDDFDDETEYELTRYYAKRTIAQNDHARVKDFLAAYRSD